ncbi:ABC transporter permease [Lachnoclostridium pacaense]|uniref:ABC transporter permease n=1 Tax=Enterocloster hominis (ex Hitch et al. 2024) TaxID=1917870 RepID=UPI001D118F3D|nr:ABC transporter permease [Lachnoclostridium pacaense]MCC2819214.1 ABC transporter permease [Lachnoclostridium pacaense]
MNKGKKEMMANVLTPLVIICMAFLFASVLILSAGFNPVAAFYHLFAGAFGTKASLINTVNKAVPIAFAGFAVALSKKAGIFNIGIEGQLIFGAFGSVLPGIFLKGLPAVIHIPVCLLSGMLFGAAYALLPTLLFVKRGTNLMVMGIMMNNIASLVITYLIVGPFAGKNATVSSTEMVEESAFLPYIITKPNKLSIGILIVFAVAFLMWLFINKTSIGYELKMCGANRQAARYSGIKVTFYMTAALLLSGALGGLAGGVEILGNYHRMYDSFSPGYGFDGIPIALLTGGNPIGVIAGALLFGALRVGAMKMQTQVGVSTEIITVIQGTLVVLIACESLIRFQLSRAGRRKEEKA